MSIILTKENAALYEQDASFSSFDGYKSGKSSFLASIMPEAILSLSGETVCQLLRQRLGDELFEAAIDTETSIPSPLAGAKDSHWMKTVNMVGINVRTIGHFWNVVKYGLSIPQTQSAIHLLPIWEPGVVESLYGMASWHINPAFFSSEMAALFPSLDTVEKQLKVTVKLLHAMGKTVGMDVIPHTDRYAEIVLTNPHFFEWLKRKGLHIIDHRADLHIEVMQAIFYFIQQHGSASPDLKAPADWSYFFSPQFTEEKRALVLFGAKEKLASRNQRREMLVDFLFHIGFEPVPATMAPPYRGIAVDPSPAAITVDYMGREWRDYQITQPGEMSRVFGPLTRYKLYERLHDNDNWEIDFSRPRTFVWEYVADQYANIARTYQLDFMRGDMSHVQMRKEGVPLHGDLYYDLHQAVKLKIQQEIPSFAYFGESFLTAPNYMGYGDEVEHLELSQADSTLGDLQSMVVGSPEFMQNFRRYLDILEHRQVAPNFTMMTADKDDPRFDHFYVKGNEVRYFLGTFIADMPSYMGLGFECRDQHLTPAPNEHYTKLYVFRMDQGPKATTGPYQWGTNTTLFHHINRIRQFAETVLPTLQNAKSLWLLAPDPTGGAKSIAWTQQESPQWLFVANLDLENAQINLKIPLQAFKGKVQQAQLVFSTMENGPVLLQTLPRSANWMQVSQLGPGEAHCYALS
ncbi:MAG: hypothetical protein R2828_00205 [Saprospiraceae bacterium]